jgi:hypothetical protein
VRSEKTPDPFLLACFHVLRVSVINQRLPFHEIFRSWPEFPEWCCLVS